MRTIGNCKDCRYWGAYKEGFCDLVDCMAMDAENTFYIEASADDDQGLDAGLKTGPMFGCVNFDN